MLGVVYDYVGAGAGLRPALHDAFKVSLVRDQWTLGRSRRLRPTPQHPT